MPGIGLVGGTGPIVLKGRDVLMLVLLSMGGLVVLAGLVDGRVVGRWKGGHGRGYICGFTCFDMQMRMDEKRWIVSIAIELIVSMVDKTSKLWPPGADERRCKVMTSSILTRCGQ